MEAGESPPAWQVLLTTATSYFQTEQDNLSVMHAGRLMARSTALTILARVSRRTLAAMRPNQTLFQVTYRLTSESLERQQLATITAGMLRSSNVTAVSATQREADDSVLLLLVLLLVETHMRSIVELASAYIDYAASVEPPYRLPAWPQLVSELMRRDQVLAPYRDRVFAFRHFPPDAQSRTKNAWSIAVPNAMLVLHDVDCSTLSQDEASARKLSSVRAKQLERIGIRLVSPMPPPSSSSSTTSGGTAEKYILSAMCGDGFWLLGTIQRPYAARDAKALVSRHLLYQHLTSRHIGGGSPATQSEVRERRRLNAVVNTANAIYASPALIAQRTTENTLAQMQSAEFEFEFYDATAGGTPLVLTTEQMNFRTYADLERTSL